jgi:WD40 repeat protein
MAVPEQHGNGPEIVHTEGTTLDAPARPAGLPPAVRRVLGGRYEVRDLLGQGGMGEVWLARDLKLQVEVALKVVRSDKLGDEGALSRLRAEVRAARAVASPHVCRVYDLVEADGLECVSMEYVDGTTLRHVLSARTPLDPAKAREIALQLLAGLDAIHEAGLVHRDVKPENVMLTRAGRVVLMDFGIAKAAASGGTIAGTPAYWAPEQAEGAPADPRADVFAAGLVLAEMVAPSGVRDRERQQALLSALREDPPRVPDTPWSEAIRKAVAREPGDRHPSAKAFARALEEVAQRVTGTGIERAQPYPGLSSFTEADAQYFFGREAEVESAWKRLPGRHLLAVVGPSGAGKSSFLRAGLIPAKPEGWAHLVCTPGDAPFVALGQALVPEVSRDTNAMRQMLRFEDADVAVELFRRWRSDHAEVLVIVDQLEELFTLNPPEVQARFASLLSRLVLEADVHVLLAMRDDFLLRCQEHEALRPVFSDLMPLGAPTGEALRRALVQPALRCGYRFEDEALVAEMLRAVEGERGALPLLAFAAASLWERRDRENGLLTRKAHDEIGGVGGALAQHAEATLGRIGPEKLPAVRELFRNLVTAEGTRAVRDVDELLTVFPEDKCADAEAVLKALIDARLLTSYEAHAIEPGQRAGRRVEVVHESLLFAWPRLVRWRTEDEAGSQLRDQLRQASRLWEEKARTEDLLWTGTAYQEFRLWRGRYPGALTALEEDFAKAMAAKAHRKRRLVQAAVAAIVVVSIGVAIAIGISRHKAVIAAQKAEAAKLLALAELRLQEDPTEALALVTASLELADSREARLFALRNLWEAPPAIELGFGKPVWIPVFSPDGRQLATAGAMMAAYVIGEDGGPPRALPGHSGLPRWVSDRLVLVEDRRRASVWSLPDLKLERTVEFAGVITSGELIEPLIGGRLFLATGIGGKEGRPEEHALWSLDPANGSRVELGRVPAHFGLEVFGPDGSSWLHARGATLLARPLPVGPRSTDTVLGEHRPEITRVFRHRNEIVTLNSAKELRVWRLEPGKAARVEDFPAPAGADPPMALSGRWLVTRLEQAVDLWKRGSWSTARPLVLRRDVSWYAARTALHPTGDWLVASTEQYSRLTFWPLRTPRPLVVDGFKNDHRLMAFSPDGSWLATSWPDEPVRLWPLTPGSTTPRTLAIPGLTSYLRAFAFDPRGRFLFCVGSSLWIVPLDGGPPFELKGFSRVPWILAAAVSPSGRSVAAAFTTGEGDRTLRVWDLETGATRAYDLPQPPRPADPSMRRFDPTGGINSLAFEGESTLYSAGYGGVRRWDLASGRQEVIVGVGEGYADMAIRPDLGVAVTVRINDELTHTVGPVTLHDLKRHTSRELPAFGTHLRSEDLDPTARVLVTTDSDGIIRVGRISQDGGGEPHLLLGHKGGAQAIVSPDLKWIASAGEDHTLRIWPMPDLDKPPLHTLPHAELVAKLKSLTNFRAVRDPKSATGWKIEIGPFPGWKDVPTWEP